MTTSLSQSVDDAPETIMASGSPATYFRRPSVIDNMLTEFGRALQVLDGSMHASRPNPAGKMPVTSGQNTDDDMMS